MDQAAALRRRLPAPAPPPSWDEGGADVTVVASGKGGTGKSLLAIGLAAALARAGRRTLLVDGASNLGNLHILLGVRPRAPLRDVMVEGASPRDLLVPVAERLDLLPADSGAESLYALSELDRARLHDRLTLLYPDYEACVVDAGSGVEAAVRACALRATRLLVVAVPEPAALADAHALVKLVHLQVPALPVEVVVNRAESEAEADHAYESLRLAARAFLGLALGRAGTVPECAALRRAARRPGAALTDVPEAVAAIAARLDARAAAARGGDACPA